MVPAEPADVTLDTALLMRTVDARLAEERLEPECDRNATKRRFSTRVRPFKILITAVFKLS